MKTASPLRYPGGKSAMAGLLRSIRRLNGLGNLPIAEPFAGGAGASLTLLFLEEAPEIHVNDADPAIHDLWWSLVNINQGFIEMLNRAEISISEWSRQRTIYHGCDTRSPLHRGFAAFYLNRCNRSGIIINGGPIGGIRQDGKWKLDARFNKTELQRRCQKVGEYRDRIHVYNMDGVEFLKRSNANCLFMFVDPPYYAKGKTLYLNTLDDSYHQRLAAHLAAHVDLPWVLTYDDCPQIRQMYEGWANVRPYGLRYSATERRSGNEILIVPKWMHLPSEQGSDAIAW